MEPLNTFDWPEYVVFGSVLVLSAGVGIFYGCFGSKQDTNEEFLMGNRQMAPLPVGLSLTCSFISATTLLGTPAEVYFYGMQYLLVIIAFIPLTICLAYIYAPVFRDLNLTSAFEYLELRFDRSARVAVSLIATIYLLMYMAIVVYGPSIALSQVTGINHRISVITIFGVCVFYSTLGGIKSVVATDVIQCCIMLISMLVVVSKSVSDLGGIGYVWEIAKDAKRLEFLNFDLDPRTRYTVWGAVVGEFSLWLAVYASTQVNIQRFGAIESISGVRRALFYNMIGLSLILSLSLTAGLVIYAKYANCDPIASKRVTSSDQLLPIFVMDTLDGTPGLPGLFVAGITCASLSSLSSGLNALAAMITEDFVKFYYPKLQDRTMASIAKGVCVLSGIISYGCTFAAEAVESIYPATTALMGSTLGPTFGIFSIGLFYPFANSKGALMGLLLGVSLAAFVSLGGVIDSANQPNQKLRLSTEDCLYFNSTDPIMDDGLHWKEKEYSFLTNIFAISYLWVSIIGSFTTFFGGIVCSLFFENKPNSVNTRCLSPVFLRFWMKFHPEKLKDVLVKPNISDSLQKESRL